MNIQIKGEGIDITKQIIESVDKKIGKELDKFLVDFDEDFKKATITIEKRTRWGFHISFDMYLPHKEHIFAEATTDTILDGLDELKDKITRELSVYKGKLTKHS